eukprot:gene15567-21664_t
MEEARRQIGARCAGRVDYPEEDPKITVEKACESHCLKEWAEYKACEARVVGDESGVKHCSGQLFDFLHCIDHCAAGKIFEQLK